MKKVFGLICIVVMALCLAGCVGPKDIKSAKVGDIVEFGNYQKQPIKWKCLAVESSKKLLITEYAIDSLDYHRVCSIVWWDLCSLRRWLNGDFLYEAFKKEERTKILLVSNANNDNPAFYTIGGRLTDDYIFCLSIDEAKKYFKNDKGRQCKPDGYAVSKGANKCTSKEHVEFLGNTDWWLRSPGEKSNMAAVVRFDGSIDSSGDYVDFGPRVIESSSVGNIYVPGLSVRPAMWVDSN